MGPQHMCVVATIHYGCMGVWSHGRKTIVCWGGQFWFFQFSGGSDHIRPKQAGLTGKATWFLPLPPTRWAILANWHKWEHLWGDYNASRV
jgi:hypothetical protein